MLLEETTVGIDFLEKYLVEAHSGYKGQSTGDDLVQ